MSTRSNNTNKNKKPFIRCDGISRWTCSDSQVSKILKNLIDSNYVKISGFPIRKSTQGVPQGSIVSTMLCNVYYSRFEKQELLPLVGGGSNNFLLLRLVDDYLFISNEASKVLKFKDVMEKGNAEWGVAVNGEKTKLSFNENETDLWIVWCGLCLNVKRRLIRLSYDKITTLEMSSAFFDLKTYLRNTLNGKVHPILYDADLHDKTNAAINFSQIFVLCAIRFHHYWKRSSSKEDCFSIITELFEYCFCLAKSRLSSSSSLLLFRFNQLEIMKIGLIAFLSVLKKKPTIHLRLISSFETLLQTTTNTIEGKEEKIEWSEVNEETNKLINKLL